MSSIYKLNPAQVRNAKARAAKYRLSDGGNLYLVVKPSGSRSWSFVYKDSGRPRELGLGGFPAISLKAARDIARDLREARARGEDPKITLRPPKGMTFGEAARGAYEKRRHGFRSRHTIRQWETDLFTRLAHWKDKPVHDIDLPDVARELRPVFAKTPESGRRFRTRIEAAFSYAIALGEYEGANPARWKDGLANVLQERSRPVKHHAAMPYMDIPGFIADLAKRDALSARCLELTVLTAARTTQARGARWSEIDLDERLWRIPENRMKAGREHVVPLSNRAMALLRGLDTDNVSPFLFPSYGREGHLSDNAMLALLKRMTLRGEGQRVTTHGFRSTLMDWMEHETTYPRDLGEHALAHAVGTQAFRAYARGSGFDRRRQMMEAWAAFCAGQAVEKVVTLYG